MSKESSKKSTQMQKYYYDNSFSTVARKTGLRAFLGNVRRGQPEVYTVPTFAKGISTQSLLKQWDAVLQSIRREWPSLYEFEIDLAKKVGPMSVTLPLKERLSDIDQYYDGILLPSKPLDESAVRAVMSEWKGLRGLTPRSNALTLRNMRLSTNSGSPFFMKKRLVVNETLPMQVGLVAVNGLHDPVPGQYLAKRNPSNPSGLWYGAAVLGWRGQEGGPSDEDVKQRVVWMFPFAVNIGELTVYQPMIEGAQKLRLVPAWVSMDEVDSRITAMFDSKASDDLVVCTDFSKFDQHFNHDLQMAAKDVLSSILEPKTSKYWLDEIFPIKYNIPLVYDVESVRFGDHGMGSGSGGTNADETLAHRALQYEAAIRTGAKLNPNSQCLGDDGVLTYPGITVDDVVAAYTSHGLEMNPDKQYASSVDCTYLRRWHHINYRLNGVCAGVYSTCRALGRLRYLERGLDDETGSDNAIVLRELSILENCKYHPLREQFVQFCMKRDKLRLGLNVPGFFDNIEGIARSLVNHMPDFLGYTKTLQSNDPVGGIADWWVVNYLMSQR